MSQMMHEKLSQNILSRRLRTTDTLRFGEVFWYVPVRIHRGRYNGTDPLNCRLLPSPLLYFRFLRWRG